MDYQEAKKLIQAEHERRKKERAQKMTQNMEEI